MPASVLEILRRPDAVALLVGLAAAATILGALGFEHIGGYVPCALCLQQRLPYYIGVPLALAAFAAARRQGGRLVAAALLAGFAGLMLYGLVLAVYHSGIEWRLWDGPASCAGSAAAPVSAGALMESLRGGLRAPSCTDATWRLLGLSFAGWNVLVSAALAGLALFGAVRAYGSSSTSQ